MSTTAISSESARRELGAGFGGHLTAPGDGSYDEARKLFNAMIDRKPALLAQCTSSDDVAHVIGFARTHDLPLAICGGGHNGSGLGSVDDGVVATCRACVRSRSTPTRERSASAAVARGPRLMRRPTRTDWLCPAE